MMLTYNKLGTNGRFGNQLFQIASTIGIAHSQNYAYGFPEWKYQEYFEHLLPKVVPNAVTLTGYLQDFLYFEDVSTSIRHYFTFKNQSALKLKKTAFIHFRGYGKEGVAQFHPEQTTEYYKRAISNFPGFTFIIFTDDIKRAKEVVQLDCEYRSGNEIEDFKFMMNCEGAIISNSSYSWWAAWLGECKTIIPKNWFTSYAEAINSKIYNSNGLYIPNWTAL